MKRKILVPTDLSVKSLNLVKEAVHESDAMELEVVLFYATHMSDSIGEMLFFSKHKLIESLSAEDFLISFDKLKESFTKRLKTISIEVFSGNNKRHLKNYIHAEGIDEIWLPVNYILRSPDRWAINPMKMLQSCGLPVHSIGWAEPEEIRLSVGSQISGFFFSKFGT